MDLCIGREDELSTSKGFINSTIGLVVELSTSKGLIVSCAEWEEKFCLSTTRAESSSMVHSYIANKIVDGSSGSMWCGGNCPFKMPLFFHIDRCNEDFEVIWYLNCVCRVAFPPASRSLHLIK